MSLGNDIKWPVVMQDLYVLFVENHGIVFNLLLHVVYAR